jgi:uncharacterized protein (DUF934 family)
MRRQFFCRGSVRAHLGLPHSPGERCGSQSITTLAGFTAAKLVLRQAPPASSGRTTAASRSYLDWVALVALVFPTFKDGRAHSQARLLRERYEFRGELRATGQLLRDQLLFLHRAGFDAFEVTKDKDAAVVVEILQRYSVFYQPTGDGRPSTLKVRLAPRRPATGSRPARSRPLTAEPTLAPLPPSQQVRRENFGRQG